MIQQPKITITVSWIKNVYLRRLALLATLPFAFVFASLQCLVLTVVGLLAVPVLRLFELLLVFVEMAPTFREQWCKKP